MRNHTTRQLAQPTIIRLIVVGELITFGTDEYTSPEFYADNLAAADAAAKLAANGSGLALSISDTLKDQLLVYWQCQGIAAYKSGRPGTLWNTYQRQGYDAAQQHSIGILAFGWPTPSNSQLYQCSACGAIYSSDGGHTCKATSTRSWSGARATQRA